MEFRKTKRYVYSLAREDITAADLVGVRALDLHKLSKCNVDIAEGFVISGNAFDEFLQANELVDDVVTLLNKIADSGISEVENYSQQMRKLILDGAIPKHIVVEIDKAYHAIARHSDAVVTVGPSALVRELDERLYKQDWQVTGYQNLQGLQAVLEQIIIVWADLFTSEAIKYRFETDYEGNLSQPVIVQKQLNPEISGQMYSFDITDSSTNSASVLAYLGILPARKLLTELEIPLDVDYYLVDKVRSAVKEKIQHEQKFMLVRNKGADTSDYSKVKISKIWSQRAKLDDQQLSSLNKTLALAETAFMDRFKLTWAYDAGGFLVTDIESYPDETALADIGSIYQKLKQERDLPRQESGKGSDLIIGSKSPSLDVSEGQSVEIPTTPKIAISLPVATTTASEQVDPQDAMLAGLNKTTEELILPEPERELKAGQIKEMLPEIKTASEVWWYPLRPASEVKVFATNLDGLGVFKLDEIIDLLGTGSLQTSQALQKQVCEYLALYLKAIAPKPLMLELSSEQNMDGQIQVLSQLRNLYGHRNFWVSMPSSTSHENLAAIKKDLSAGGFRRTASFKVYQTVSQPIFFTSIAKVFEQGIDGVILDLDKIIESIYGSNLSEVVLHISTEKELILDYFDSQLARDSEYKTKMLIKTESREIFELLLSPMLEHGVNGLVYCWQDVYEFKSTLASMESDILTSSLKKIKKKLNKI